MERARACVAVADALGRARMCARAMRTKWRTLVRLTLMCAATSGGSYRRVKPCVANPSHWHPGTYLSHRFQVQGLRVKEPLGLRGGGIGDGIVDMTVGLVGCREETELVAVPGDINVQEAGRTAAVGGFGLEGLLQVPPFGLGQISKVDVRPSANG